MQGKTINLKNQQFIQFLNRKLLEGLEIEDQGPDKAKSYTKEKLAIESKLRI